MTAVLAALLLLWAPRLAAAQLSGQCLGGACADGYRGCKCDASCCERRLRQKAGASGGGGGYNSQMATFGMMSDYALKYFDATSQRAALAEEQRRIAELERRAREREEQERRAKEFRDDRDRALSEMKESDVPDLGRSPEFKMEEPAPRKKKAAGADKDIACRGRFPGLEPAASYIQRMAAFEKECGADLAGDQIAKAASTKVAAVIGYESRIHRLLKKGSARTKDDLWELNRLLDEGESLTGSLSAAERDQLLGLPHPELFDPVDDEGIGLLDGIRLEELKALPPMPVFRPGDAMLGAINRLDAFAKKLPDVPDLDEIHVDLPAIKTPDIRLPGKPEALKSWKGVGHWIGQKKEEGRQAVARELAVLAGYGMKNESEYAP